MTGNKIPRLRTKTKQKTNKSAWDQGPLVCLSVINNRKSAFQGLFLSAHGGRVLHVLKTKIGFSCFNYAGTFPKKRRKKQFTRSICATSAVASVLTLYSGKQPQLSLMMLLCQSHLCPFLLTFWQNVSTSLSLSVCACV